MPPRVSPLPDWTGEDVFIIGGGKSLKDEGFDWSWLHGRNTIGCNQAFILGVDVCNVCTFGDLKFWDAFKDKLGGVFEGWVATNYWVMNPPPWLKLYKRQDNGLSTTMICWNNNTGAIAVNLALIMGASRVFLLGFDMHSHHSPQPGKNSHWHDQELERSTPEHFGRFRVGFASVQAHLPNVFPGRKVINVNNGGSTLTAFPQMTLDQVKETAP